MLRAHLSSAGHPASREPEVGPNPLLMGKTSVVVIIFPFASHLPRDAGLDLTPSYLSCCGSFFFTFSCGKSFLLVLR